MASQEHVYQSMAGVMTGVRVAALEVPLLTDALAMAWALHSRAAERVPKGDPHLSVSAGVRYRR